MLDTSPDAPGAGVKPIVHANYEETGRGVDKLDLVKLAADVAYTLDGSATGGLFTETFNAAEAVLTVQGVSVHPGYAKGIMVNAIRILAELIDQLPAAEAPETTEGREGYVHPHTLASGDPARARAKLLLRNFTAEGLQRQKDLLAGLVGVARLKYPKARVTLEITDQYKNMRSDGSPQAALLSF